MELAFLGPMIVPLMSHAPIPLLPKCALMELVLSQERPAPVCICALRRHRIGAQMEAAELLKLIVLLV